MVATIQCFQLYELNFQITVLKLTIFLSIRFYVKSILQLKLLIFTLWVGNTESVACIAVLLPLLNEQNLGRNFILTREEKKKASIWRFSIRQIPFSQCENLKNFLLFRFYCGKFSSRGLNTSLFENERQNDGKCVSILFAKCFWVISRKRVTEKF